jgi:hypothetical protein
MTTILHEPLKRELTIGGSAYTLTIDPHGFKLVPKGKRKGYELEWASIVSGEAALATALNAMLAKAPEARQEKPATMQKQIRRPRK